MVYTIAIPCLTYRFEPGNPDGSTGFRGDEAVYVKRNCYYGGNMRLLKVFFILFTVCFFGELNAYSSENMQDLMKTERVIGEVTAETILYRHSSTTGGRFGLLNPGEKVEIIRDKSTKWYYVHAFERNAYGWIKSDSLKIPVEGKVDLKALTEEELEEYANTENFKSETNFFVLADIRRQKLYIYKKSESKWKIQKIFDCATGKNESPTIKGDYKLSGRGNWFYSERLGSGGMYWIRFYGPYLIHSVAMDKNKNITDGVVSEKRSSGCIRLLVDDAKWVYENVPDGTDITVK